MFCRKNFTLDPVLKGNVFPDILNNCEKLRPSVLYIHSCVALTGYLYIPLALWEFHFSHCPLFVSYHSLIFFFFFSVFTPIVTIALYIHTYMYIRILYLYRMSSWRLRTNLAECVITWTDLQFKYIGRSS